MNYRQPPDSCDDYLSGESEISRGYREISGEQPPSHLDGVILSAARDAVMPKARKILFPQRWMLPLATAATLLLAVGLVGLMSPWTKSRVDTAPMEPAYQSAIESLQKEGEPDADDNVTSSRLGRQVQGAASETAVAPATKAKRESRVEQAAEDARSMMTVPAVPVDEKKLDAT
ncbi:MAG: hypothetical protein OEU36_23140, partial [Gammaproteobacteria bacterium]|nr:hypothetical protein [Gammaproteobacteria bacterium]